MYAHELSTLKEPHQSTASPQVYEAATAVSSMSQAIVASDFVAPHSPLTQRHQFAGLGQGGVETGEVVVSADARHQAGVRDRREWPFVDAAEQQRGALAADERGGWPADLHARSIEQPRGWTIQRHKHDLFISPEVVGELSRPEYRHRDEALLMTVGLEMVAIEEEVRGLARILVREKVMPGPEGAGDALHVAAATVHRMDVMIFWNVKHLANRNKVAHLREIRRRVGFVSSEIVTPDSFWQEEDTA
jgi:hypothetical protein